MAERRKAKAKATSEAFTGTGCNCGLGEKHHHIHGLHDPDCASIALWLDNLKAERQREREDEMRRRGGATE